MVETEIAMVVRTVAVAIATVTTLALTIDLVIAIFAAVHAIGM